MAPGAVLLLQRAKRPTTLKVGDQGDETYHAGYVLAALQWELLDYNGMSVKGRAVLFQNYLEHMLSTGDKGTLELLRDVNDS